MSVICDWRGRLPNAVKKIWNLWLVDVPHEVIKLDCSVRQWPPVTVGKEDSQWYGTIRNKQIYGKSNDQNIFKFLLLLDKLSLNIFQLVFLNLVSILTQESNKRWLKFHSLKYGHFTMIQPPKNRFCRWPYYCEYWLYYHYCERKLRKCQGMHLLFYFKMT